MIWQIAEFLLGFFSYYFLWPFYLLVNEFPKDAEATFVAFQNGHYVAAGTMTYVWILLNIMAIRWLFK